MMQEQACHEAAEHGDSTISIDSLTHFAGKRILEAVKEPSQQHLELVDAIDEE